MSEPRHSPVTARSGGVLVMASRHLDRRGRGMVQWWGGLLHRRAELIVDGLPPVPVPRSGWAVISGDPARGARVSVREYYWPLDWPVTEASVTVRPAAESAEAMKTEV